MKYVCKACRKPITEKQIETPCETCAAFICDYCKVQHEKNCGKLEYDYKVGKPLRQLAEIQTQVILGKKNTEESVHVVFEEEDEEDEENEEHTECDSCGCCTTNNCDCSAYDDNCSCSDCH